MADPATDEVTRQAVTGEPGPGRREQRRIAKDRVSREHILDAAEHIFGGKGFHSATLREIAEQAEFSVGALYGFFDGKDDLLIQVLERQGNGLLEAQEEAVAGLGSAPEKLHRLVEVQLEYFRMRPDFYRLFQRELGGSTWTFRASLNERGDERYRAVMEFEEEIFAAGIAEGVLIAGDPVVQAALFSGLMQAYIAQWVDGLGPDGVSDVETRCPLDQLHAVVDRAFVVA